jgi:hypothetical protein
MLPSDRLRARRALRLRLSLPLALASLFAVSALLFTGAGGCDPNPPRRITGSGGATGTGGVTASGGTTGVDAGTEEVGSGGSVGSGGGVAEGGAAGGEASSGGAKASGGSAGGAGGSGGAAGHAAGGATSSGGAGGGASSGGGASGENLVTNGDFSMGEMFWKVDASSITHSVVDGAECLMFSGGAASFFLGWPDPVANALSLKGGTTYKLTYRASSTGPLSVKVEAKVGKAVDPFTDDLPLVTDAVGTSLQTFTHTFTPTSNDTQAGVAFKVTPGSTTSQMTTVCFDDVVLAKQ